MPLCGFEKGRDLTSAQVSKDRVWHGGSGDGSNDKREQVGVPSLVPKSYQCSARIPRGPGSLRRGMRFELSDPGDENM